jgi:hypothetical protein
MSLIKKKDTKSYFATRRSGQPFRVKPSSEPDAVGSAGVEKPSANGVNVIEVPGSKSSLVESPVSPVMSARSPSIASEPVAKISARA